MQGGRNMLNSFPDTIDLNQGSVSSTNAVSHSATWDNLLNPVESRPSTYMLSSGERSVGCTSTSSHNSRSFSGWDAGESSSVAQDCMYGDDLKIGQGWSTSAGAIPDAMHEHGSEPSGVFRSERGSSYGSRRVLNLPDSGSNHCPRNTDLCDGYMGNTEGGWPGTSSSGYWPAKSETHERSTFGGSSNNLVASSSSSGYLIENAEESGSSFGAWGSSGKRKALESIPAQPYTGGSSTSHPQAENTMWHAGLAHHNASESITMPSPPGDWSYSCQPEQINPRISFGMRGTSSERLPPINITGVADNAAGNVGGRLNLGHQEPDMFSFPVADTALRPSSGNSSHQPSRPFASSDPSMMMNSCNPLSQPQATHAPRCSGSSLPYRWNGSFDQQSGSSLNSFIPSGDRSAAFVDEQRTRSSLRNTSEVPAFVSSSERRSFGQDSSMLNSASENARSSRGLFSSSRGGSSSSSRNLSTGWTAHPNMSAHNQQSFTEYAPWTLFPPPAPNYVSQRGHFPVIPSASSSSVEAAMPSSSRRRQHQYSSSALLMAAPSGAISGRRALAVDIEGRHRLIRQVRNAVRRGDHWRAQDFAVFDPFISGVAELHDRHSDMRLDVDNMSYEELLALEERIGNVSTGLSEEIIMRSMKQRKHEPMDPSSNSEPCCICQEEYVGGDDIGIAVCGHEFHTNCIKQWLLLKNLCPICKMTALET